MNAAYATLFLGRRDEAYAFFDKLQSIRPDPGLATTLWFAALAEHDPRAKDLEATVHKLASEDQWLSAQSSLALWHGRFKEFGKINDELKNRARATRNEQALQNLESSEEVIQAIYLGGPHLERVKAHAAKETNPAVLAQLTAALAANGELTIVRATLPRLLKEGRSNQAIWLPTTVAQAYVLLTDGKKNEALTLVRQALNDVPRAFDFNYFIGYIQGSSRRHRRRDRQLPDDSQDEGVSRTDAGGPDDAPGARRAAREEGRHRRRESALRRAARTMEGRGY